MGKYALLLSGGISNEKNYPRYKNDLEWIFHVLVTKCNYKPEDIGVFYADGKPLACDGVGIPTRAADRKAIVEQLEAMAQELTEEDVFTFVVSNHGNDTKSGGCINLWGRASVLELEELASKLNQIKAQKIIVLGECYGGNILNWEIDNSCTVTANEIGQVSYTNPKNKDYDEFILHFFSYINGAYPDGRSIPQGENDVEKAVQYARSEDAIRPGGEWYAVLKLIMDPSLKQTCTEIPQVKSNVGGKVRL